MVAILAVEVLHVQAHAAIASQGVEELLEEFGIHLADLVAAEVHFPHQIRPLAKVQRGAGKRFVHWHIGMAKPGDAGEIAQRLHDGLTDYNARILDAVVHVDVQVALAANRQVDR